MSRHTLDDKLKQLPRFGVDHGKQGYKDLSSTALDMLSGRLRFMQFYITAEGRSEPYLWAQTGAHVNIVMEFLARCHDACIPEFAMSSDALKAAYQKAEPESIFQPEGSYQLAGAGFVQLNPERKTWLFESGSDSYPHLGVDAKHLEQMNLMYKKWSFAV